MRAGFFEVDITPKPGAEKIGWLKPIKGEVVLDPIMARIAVFENDGRKAGFIQLDTLSVRWTTVDDMRRRIREKFGFPAENIMVSASHNHAGPAVAGFPPAQFRDDAYVEEMTRRCVDGFGEAIAAMSEAVAGFNHAPNFDVAHNRRTVMRNGLVRSQTMSSDKDFLCLEGPRDPELAALVVRNLSGDTLGALVNYACHPTHHGGTNEFSAGYPGVLAAELKKRGCPVTLFLNGAYGNVITVDFERRISLSKEEAGKSLADSFSQAADGMTFSGNWEIDARAVTLDLPYRKFTPEEESGKISGAQRYSSDENYAGFIGRLKENIAAKKAKKADLQVIRLGGLCFAWVPAEYFVEFQLMIKQKSRRLHALVVGGANGMMGYVPTREAFSRGGYETTLAGSSCMSPETGDIIADKIVEIINQIS